VYSRRRHFDAKTSGKGWIVLCLINAFNIREVIFGGVHCSTVIYGS